MKTGTQDKASDQISLGKIDSNKNVVPGNNEPVKSSGENCIDQVVEENVSTCSVMDNVHNDSSKSTDPVTLVAPVEREKIKNANLNDESTVIINVESSDGSDKSIRRSGRKPSSLKLSLSNDSDIPVLLVDSHSKLPLTGNVSQITKNKPMAIKVVGKTDLSTQDLVAKAKKMLTFLSRSKSAKKSPAQNSKPIRKIVTSTPVNIKKVQVSTTRGQRPKEDVMKELIASTPSGFSVTRTYSGLRDKMKESKDNDASCTSSSNNTPASSKLISASLPNLPSYTVTKSPPSSTSTSVVGCTDDISTIELFDDGLKPITGPDVPSASQSSQDLLSKNRCAISICKHMSGECNLASRSSESSDGRAWYNFLRVADPAHYTSPVCPMKQIFLCFCHFSPEYVVYAPRLRSHSIPTISLPRHLNQNSTVKNKGDRIKDERLLYKKLQDSETKVRELEYKVKNMNSILSKFSQDELRKIQGRAVKWSKGTLEKALSVRALVGPSAYEHISKLFPLPSLRVLNNLPDEFLKELNVDRCKFPSKNKGKTRDRTKANQEKETSNLTSKKKRSSVAGGTKDTNSSQVVSSATVTTEARNELNQAIETINSQSITNTSCTIPRTHLDEFASHALLDISHMYPSNPSINTLSISSLTPETSSLQIGQAFAEIDLSSFASSSSMPFTSSVLTTPQATTVQTIHVTSIPSNATYTVSTVTPNSNGDKVNSPSKLITLTRVQNDRDGKNKSNHLTTSASASSASTPAVTTVSSSSSSSSPSSGAIYNRKRKLVVTPRFGRNAPKAVNATGKSNISVDDETSTINLPDGNQLDVNHSITMDIDLPPDFDLSSSSTSTSHKLNTHCNRVNNNNNNSVSRANHQAASSCHGKNAQNISSSSSPSNASDTVVVNASEPAAKKSKQNSPVKFELVSTENLTSKERITVFNVLTEIHVKFKAQYHRCSTCCLFLHGDALNQFMRMVETNIVKYSHFLSDLASTSVKTFQEEMVEFVKKLKPDIFPKCPLYNDHLRFLIVEYISASINCKRSKLASSSTLTTTSAGVTSANQATCITINSTASKIVPRGQNRSKSVSSTSSSLSSNDLVTGTSTAASTAAQVAKNNSKTNDSTEKGKDEHMPTGNSGKPCERLTTASSSSVTVTLVS